MAGTLVREHWTCRDLAQHVNEGMERSTQHAGMTPHRGPAIFLGALYEVVDKEGLPYTPFAADPDELGVTMEGLDKT